MRRHFVNAMYGLADYASYPLVMLLAAPVVLRRLGASEYGLWILATAVISVGGIIASGFCDANIRRIASLRGRNDIAAMVRSVRSILAINLSIAATLTIVVFVGAPYAAAHFARSSSTPVSECLVCLRIAGVLVIARAVESVAVSTQRAFECYREPVSIGISVRVLTLVSAIVLAVLGARSVALLISTGVFLVGGCWMQLRQLRRFFGAAPLWPKLYREEAPILLGSGFFLWLQAIGGVVFGYLDRILLGLFLGAETVTPYVLCIQFAQPVFGVTASGLHFLFPHLSARVDSMSPGRFRRAVGKAIGLNVLAVGTISGALFLFGGRFMRIWAGPALAHKTHGVFGPIVLSAALTGLSVTGIYTLQALGQFRTVSIILLSSRAGMSLLMFFLLRRDGINGLLVVRVLYGALTLLVYAPLVLRLRSARAATSSHSAEPVSPQLLGGSEA